ncbi:MAG: hypothetical protein JSR80_06935 [Verrucomicrobia bacterium]|nr:hypothetical protein [Verrucomicrobiota bacterium]
MLSFLRRYQRFFFIIITAVIVTSFSFFGSYGALTNKVQDDPIAFTRIDGKEISLSKLHHMQRFLASDQIDKFLIGGMSGANGLNDGVVRTDILGTGIGRLLATEYLGALLPELKIRAQRERRYTPYVHPSAPFISAETIWEHYAPQVKATYDALIDANDPLSADAFAQRTLLYLAQTSFPQQALKQVVQMQEKAYQWIEPDPILPQRDLNLFGYHSLENWFGSRFLTLVSEFVINAAAEAQKHGYSVSKEEAWSSLVSIAKVNFERLQRSPFLTATTPEQFLRGELVDLGLDQAAATEVWQQVLLFRRYFDDKGSLALLDRFAFDQVYSFLGQKLDVTRYTLSPQLFLKNKGDLAEFQIYLASVAADERDLPLKFKPAEAVPPELAFRSFRLRIAQANKGDLRRQIPVRALLDWQLEEANWNLLTLEIPLLNHTATGRDERFASLESLDPQQRARANTFAQNALIAAHPEWFQEALDEANVEEKEIAIFLAGGKDPLPNLTERKDLIAFLDALVQGQTADYTQSEDALLRLEVLSTAPLQVASFAQARASGSLTDLTRRKLLAHYQKMREADPAPFLDREGNFKRFADVQEIVAANYFSPLSLTDEAAHHRFDLYLEQVRLIGEPIQFEGLASQWQVQEQREQMSRGQGLDELFELKEGELSRLLSTQGHLPSFVKIIGHRTSGTVDIAVEQAQQALAAEAKRELMRDLLQIMREKNGIKLQEDA